MRVLASWFLAAGLAIGGAAIIPIPSWIGSAAAQTFAVGEGARVLGASDTRINVRSAPPITVLRAIGRSRGLAEIIMSDAAGRRWDCVIRETGGTPMRYDPLSGAVYMRDRMGNEPFFAIGEERPALDPNCFRFERVIDPTNGEMLGWLYYRTCP